MYRIAVNRGFDFKNVAKIFLGYHFVGRSHCEKLAFAYCRKIIRVARGKIYVVQNHYNGYAEFAVKPPHQFEHFYLITYVEISGRLVYNN